MSEVDLVTSRETGASLDGGADENETTSDVFLKAETGTVYKTRDEAIKGITEKDRFIAELKAKLESKQSQDELLSKISDSVQRGVAPKKPEVDPQELLTKYAERIDKEGGVAVVELMDNYLRVKEQEESRKLDELLKRRDAEIQSLREQLLDFDPRYQARKEQVDEVQSKYGVPREVAVKIVNDLIKQAEHPERPALPGTTESIRSGRSETVSLGAESKALLNRALGKPLTKEEEKALLEREAQRKGRIR